jgi:serine-type D-Ala-D-Ala carboxypeptidase/endopeptidase
VIFIYTHPQAFDASLIKSVHVAGSSNVWTADNDNYKMAINGNQVYELELPKSSFNKGETYLFKFVINKVGWLMTPKIALNVDDLADKNLTLKIE